MRTVDPDLQAEFERDALTLCRLVRITPRTGDAIYLTDHDQDLIVGSTVYLSRYSFVASSIEYISETGTSNFELLIALNEDLISGAQLRAGVFDDAPVQVEAVSWAAADAGTLLLFSGKVTSISIPNNLSAQFVAEAINKAQSKSFGEVYTPTCRAQFGDDRCKFPIETVTEEFTVETLNNATSFASADIVFAAGAHNLGTVVWLSGANMGQAMEVADHAAGGNIRLFARMRYPIEVGDMGKVYRGCDKTVAMCTNDYNNILNYRGEPNVPGDTNRR